MEFALVILFVKCYTEGINYFGKEEQICLYY